MYTVKTDGEINPWGNIGGSPLKTPGDDKSGTRRPCEINAKSARVSPTIGGTLYNETETYEECTYFILQSLATEA